MDVLEMTMPFERHLCAKADGLRIPIGATVELLPVCNMDCKMCYVKMSWEQMKKQRELLSVNEWINIIEEAQSQGLLFVLLTGGEPLLYPGFKELYLKLKNMGLILCVNTNGTMINEEMADFFAENPPRRINISIYGSSDRRYEELCGNPDGFSQMMNGVRLLKERGIAVKWNYSVTRYNVEDIEEIYRLAKENDIYVETAYYMFPSVRREKDSSYDLRSRLTPKDAAKVRVLSEIYDLGKENFYQKCKVINALRNDEIIIEKPVLSCSFTCRAGTSTFWYNWKGEMISCGMLGMGSESVLTKRFEKAWDKTKKFVVQFKHPEKCAECKYETICVRCAAASYAEENSFEESPLYVCELMEWYLKYVELLEDEENLPKNLTQFDRMGINQKVEKLD